MNGLLLVDKPAGITSHDVVARIRRALGEKRVGHAGTLDPPATGLLVVGVGRATRLLRFLEVHDKTYECEIVFGATTTTQDATGEVLVEADASALTEQDVRAVLPRFTGAIEQVPPMVSALKVGGVRLHTLARRGQEVERAPRPVTIHTFELLGFDGGVQPVARARVRCSKGTYIRTLAADVGEALVVGAHLRWLRRTAIGPFDVTDAVPVEQVSPDALRPIEDAVRGYPRHLVDDEDARALIQGKPLPAAGKAGPYAVVGPRGLIAMAEDRADGCRTLCVVAQ